MAHDESDIVILDRKIEPRELARLTQAVFQDMVKYVVDLRRRLIAIGGELHADGESLLLKSGSRQEDIWGANYYPGRGPESCIEYTALINIRPAAGNRAMEIAELYIAPTSNPEQHDRAFRCLLCFTPATYLQLPFVLP